MKRCLTGAQENLKEPGVSGSHSFLGCWRRVVRWLETNVCRTTRRNNPENHDFYSPSL